MIVTWFCLLIVPDTRYFFNPLTDSISNGRCTVAMAMAGIIPFGSSLKGLNDDCQDNGLTNKYYRDYPFVVDYWTFNRMS